MEPHEVRDVGVLYDAEEYKEEGYHGRKLVALVQALQTCALNRADHERQNVGVPILEELWRVWAVGHNWQHINPRHGVQKGSEYPP